MKQLKKVTAALLCMIAFVCFLGCDTGYNAADYGYTPQGNTAQNSQAEKADDTETPDDGGNDDGTNVYTPAPKSLLGICERTSDITTNVDSGATQELVAGLSGALGADAFRVWMHYPNIVRWDTATDSPQIIQSEANKYHAFIERLIDSGVTRIMAMTHYYVMPPSLGCSDKQIPLPGTANYNVFLRSVEATAKLLAQTFPQIKYWEPGNEPELKGAFVVRPVPDASGSIYFSTEELAKITMNICYYANRGIKSVSQSNRLVMPGLIFDYADKADFFIKKIYAQIKSGTLPDGGAKSTDPDDYFDILCWHPYYANARNPSQEWIDGNKAMYKVAAENGDGDKDVFFSELGYSDYGDKDTIDGLKDSYTHVFDIIREQMPWVKTVFLFRLLDWRYTNAPSNERERYFGLFYSPNENRGCVPKIGTVSLFYYFNGHTADVSRLFEFVKS